MSNPYAAPCSNVGACTEKGMAEPGLCVCKARVESIDNLKRAIKDMIEAIPGGQYCDPQEVADTLRAIADAALDHRPAQMKGRE